MLKNAIDYLFNEWSGKSAMIVSYGGHGGTKSANQFHQILQAIKMNIIETIPTLTFLGRLMIVKASEGEDIGLNEENGLWEIEGQEIRKGGDEIMAVVSKFSV